MNRFGNEGGQYTTADTHAWLQLPRVPDRREVGAVRVAEDVLIMPRSPEIDLEIVHALIRILERHGSPETASEQMELSLLEDRLREIVASGIPSSPEAHDQLKRLFDKNPSLFSDVSVETVKEAISFVLACCAHYSEIKRRRPFTNEEQELGKELKRCLSEARTLLDEFRKRN